VPKIKKEIAGQRRKIIDQEKFFELLKARELPEEKFEYFFAAAMDFENYLLDIGADQTFSAEQVVAYSERLIAEQENQYDNYVAVAQYARYCKNNQMLSAIIELVDGAEVMDNFYKILGERVGEELRDKVFDQIELPPLGTPSGKKTLITQQVMERFDQFVDTEIGNQILSECLRSLPEDFHKEARQMYRESSSLKEFLQTKGDEFIAELETLKDNDALFFTQPITDEVIAYINNTPEIRQGVVDRDVIYEAKIPYMAIEYLNETNELLKRYYYCHCPWVRESIPSEEVHITPNFCKCSAGFHAKYWQAAFDQPVEVEVIETVLQGDPWCKFAIHLPKDEK
jgi:hypothetical protein